MKNINTIINGILVIAVIALFVMYSNLKNSMVPAEEASIDSTSTIVEIKNDTIDSIFSKRILDFPIAFVNLDSISENFEYFTQQRASQEKAIINKRNSLKSQADRIGREYQEFVLSIQNGTTTLTTQEQVQEKELSFQKKGEDLSIKQQKFEQKIALQQQDLLIETNNSLKAFLKKYKEDLNYSYVLPGGTTGSLLYANDSLDITKEVIIALNAEYKDKVKK